MELLTSQIKIICIRQQYVMLDFDLARIYDIKTKVLNQAVSRNRARFPEDFMFRLNKEEWTNLMQSQFVTASMKKRNLRVLPFAFTEHGVTMLSSILRSQRAIKMNIAIVRAFIAMRNILIDLKALNEQLILLKSKMNEHDDQLNEIYASIEMLLLQKKNHQDWNERERIGFKINP